MVTLRLIELRSIITLADWLWQRARANHPTFLPVCVRMAAHAHYSIYQSASLDNYIYGLFLHLVSRFIHSGYFYSTSSRPLLLRGTPDYSIHTVSELTHRSTTCN